MFRLKNGNTVCISVESLNHKFKLLPNKVQSEHQFSEQCCFSSASALFKRKNLSKGPLWSPKGLSKKKVTGRKLTIIRLKKKSLHDLAENVWKLKNVRKDIKE